MSLLPDAFDLGAEALWEARARGEKLFRPDVAQIFRTAYQAFQVSHPPTETQPPKAKRASRARNPIFDALCEFEGIDPLNVMKQAAGRVAEARKQILEVAPDVTPEEIKARGEKYVRLYPNIQRTVLGLCSHWHKCGTSINRTQLARNDAYQEPPNWKEAAARAYPGTEIPEMVWEKIPHSIKLDIKKLVQ